MGMFDDVRVEYPLPDPEYQDNHFQTKDLGQTMTLYKISKEGRLLQERYDLEDIPEAEQEPAPRPWMVRTHRRVNHRWHDEEWHGDVVFYDRIFPPGRTSYADSRAIEYRARFTEGTVQWIRREPDPV